MARLPGRVQIKDGPSHSRALTETELIDLLACFSVAILATAVAPRRARPTIEEILSDLANRLDDHSFKARTPHVRKVSKFVALRLMSMGH